MSLTLWGIPCVATLRLKRGVIAAALSVIVVVRVPGRATAATAAITIATWRSGLSAGALGRPVAGASPITTWAPGATPIWLSRGAPSTMTAGP